MCVSRTSSNVMGAGEEMEVTARVPATWLGVGRGRGRGMGRGRGRGVGVGRGRGRGRGVLGVGLRAGLGVGVGDRVKIGGMAGVGDRERLDRVKLGDRVNLGQC